MTSIKELLDSAWNSHRGMICILFGGAVGGYTSTIIPATDNPIASSVFPSVFLGALAAFLFVVLVSNTDRSDIRRLVAISIVSGMTWQTVIVSVRDSQNFNEDLQAVAQAAATLQSVGDRERPDKAEEKAEYRNEVDAELESVVTLARSVNTGAAQNAVSELLSARLEHDISERTPGIINELRSIGISVDYPRLLPDASEVALILRPGNLLDMAVPDRTEVFIRMEIPQAGHYTLDVTSHDRDLVAIIHRMDNFQLMATNDDSDNSLNPRISMDFESGNYYLHVMEFLKRNLSSFTAELSRAKENSDPENRK